MAQTPSDGKWRALDGEAILKSYRLAAGYLYQAQLRDELTRTLGVEWEQPHKGMAELAAVPREVIREFSTRRAQVVEQLGRQGGGGFYAAQRRGRRDPRAQGARRPRRAARGLARPRRRARPRHARAATRSLGRARHRELSARRAARDRAPACSGPSGLTEKRTAFSEPELVMAWAEAHAQGASADRVRRSPRGSLGRDGVEPVGEQPQPGPPRPLLDGRAVAVEQAALALVERGRDAGAPSITEQRLDEIERADRIALADEQEAMVREVATSPTASSASSGSPAPARRPPPTPSPRSSRRPASTSSAPRRPASPPRSSRTRPASPPPRSTGCSRRAPRRRPASGPCSSSTRPAWPRPASSRPLLELVEQAHGKAILIGDPHQLPAVGAGGLFAGIVERHGAVELTENRRQHDELERRRARSGPRRRSAATTSPSPRSASGSSSPRAPSRRERACSPTGGQHARDDLPGNVMLALRRRDVAELNQLARALMDSRRPARQASGSASPAREFAAGDRVVCLRNSDRARRQERHPRHRRANRPRPADARRRDRPRPDASSSAAATSRRATSATPTRSPATPPRASPSSAPSSSAPARRACRSGATSPSPAPARRPASTSPATRASTRATSTTSTTATRSPASAGARGVRDRAARRRPATAPVRAQHEARPEIERATLSPDDQLHLRLLEQKRRALVEDARRGRAKAGDGRARARAVRPAPAPPS